MGGVDPSSLEPAAQMMMPDQSAANHTGDQPAAATVFRRCQELGVRLIVLTRAAAYGASVPAFIYDELATVLGRVRLRLRARARLRLRVRVRVRLRVSFIYDELATVRREWCVVSGE